MKPYPIHDLVYLGTIVRYLQDITSGSGVQGTGYVLHNLKTFFETVDSLGLKVTRQHGVRLAGLIGELEAYAEGQRLSEPHAEKITKEMSSIRETLLAETSILTTYLLTEKRLDVKRLTEGPESFLRQETFAKLPAVAQYDIRQAGKCIAFELPTAAGFHLLRATEDTLRLYCRHFIRRGQEDNPMWGQMISALRAKKRQPSPDKTLLDHLDNIRLNFRNPTDHPEMIYSMDEAQDLFPLVADVLNRMTKVLP